MRWCWSRAIWGYAMNDASREFAEIYASELRNYLAGAGETGLQRAYELGRLAVESGLGLLDIEAIYREALAAELERAPSAEEGRHAVAMAADFRAESLAPFEMTHRGFREANEELRQLNETLKSEVAERKRAEAALQKAHDDLDRRVRLRTIELVQANADLQAEIHERKRYEAELRLRDRAIEASSVGIIITDARRPNYPIIYANPAFARITGFSLGELIGRNPRILQGPDTDPEAIAEIRQALSEGRDCHLTLKNYRKDGMPFWNELFISPVRDERGRLTHYIGTQTDVTELRRAEEERHEMEIAKQIQLSLLPDSPLQVDGAFVAGYCLPATHVGGDYFDYFRGPDSVDIVIADVSGHSMGAALVMAEARSTLKAEALHRLCADGTRIGTGEILHTLNALLYDDLNRAELFITMFYMKYHHATRQLRYANAGHNRPLLLPAGEAVCQELDADGLVFGVSREVAFEEKNTVLQKGDLVLLYTDGITEAQNPEGEFFGIDRLCRIFAAQGANTPQEIIDNIVEELRIFRRGNSFADDISVVVLKIT
jgi:PAS domain S-box-containing protein